MLPVTPMVSVTKPATVDRGSKVGETPNPINSTEAPPSLLLRKEPFPVFLQHPDIQPDPPKVFLQFTILHPGSEWISDVSCVQVVQWRIGLLVLSLSNKRVQTCET